MIQYDTIHNNNKIYNNPTIPHTYIHTLVITDAVHLVYLLESIRNENLLLCPILQARGKKEAEALYTYIYIYIFTYNTT